MSSIQPSPAVIQRSGRTTARRRSAHRGDLSPDQHQVENGRARSSLQRHEALVVTVPGALIAALLTAWNYSSKPMWRDEWYTYSASERTLPQLGRLVSNIDGGLSVFYFFMHSWMLLSNSVAWMRVPAGICTVLIAIFAAQIGRRVGGVSVGFASGTLAALLPAVVDHAQEARAYPLVMAGVAGTVLTMLHYLEKLDRRRGATLTVVALAAASLHPIVGAPAVAGIFCGALISPGRSQRARLLLLGLPAGTASIALFAVGFEQVDATGVSTFQGYSSLLKLGDVISPFSREIGVVALLVLVAVVQLARRDRPALMVLLGSSTFPVALVALLSMANSFHLSRYVSVVVVGVSVLTALGIVELSTTVSSYVSAPHRWLTVLFLTSATVVGLVAPLVPGTMTARTSSYRTDDPRSAARALGDGWRAGDAVVFFGPPARGLTGFYAPEDLHLVDPLLLSSAKVDDSYSGREVDVGSVRKILSRYQRVWFVGFLHRDKVPEVEKRQSATPGRELVRRQDFGEFSLELWQKSPRR